MADQIAYEEDWFQRIIKINLSLNRMLLIEYTFKWNGWTFQNGLNPTMHDKADNQPPIVNITAPAMPAFKKLPEIPARDDFLTGLPIFNPRDLVAQSKTDKLKYDLIPYGKRDKDLVLTMHFPKIDKQNHYFQLANHIVLSSIFSGVFFDWWISYSYNADYTNFAGQDLHTTEEEALDNSQPVPSEFLSAAQALVGAVPGDIAAGLPPDQHLDVGTTSSQEFKPSADPIQNPVPYFDYKVRAATYRTTADAWPNTPSGKKAKVVNETTKAVRYKGPHDFVDLKITAKPNLEVSIS